MRLYGRYMLEYIYVSYAFIVIMSKYQYLQQTLSFLSAY